MAEDTNKKLSTDGGDEQETKEWDWDTEAPEATADVIEVDTLNVPQTQKSTVADPEPEEGCCIICGEKLRKSPSELYCNVCREKYMKVNYGARHIILSIVMMFVAVIGIVAFSTTSQIVANISEGDKHLENNHIARALDSYNAVDSTAVALNDGFNAFLQGISTNFDIVNVYDAGTAVDKKLAEVMCKTITTAYTDREAFISIVENSFTKAELTSDKYAHIKECYDFCKNMDDTANNIYDGWYALLETRLAAFDENGKLTDDKAPTIEEILAFIDDYESKHPEADKSMIEYYKAMTLYPEYGSFGTGDINQMLKYIKNAYDAAGKFNYFYSDYYLIFALEAKEYDSLIEIAKETLEINPGNENAYFHMVKALAAKSEWQSASDICEDLRKYNPDSLEYYLLKAEVLRRSGDYSAAIDICIKGEKVADDSELLRQKSIAYMLNEEKDKALETANAAYEAAYYASYSGGSVSLEVLNTSALISYLCDKEKTLYNEIESLFKTENVEFADSIKSVINGDTTFEELFTTGKGDL